MSSTLATEADSLALELVEASHKPARVLAIAARLAALAADLHQREAVAVPPHLREAPHILPDGVAAIWLHGRWIERQGARA